MLAQDLLRSAVEAEKSKVRELEDLLQAMRAKEHAAVNAEQAAVVDSVGLHQRLQTALNENEKNVSNHMKMLGTAQYNVLSRNNQLLNVSIQRLCY